MSFAPRFEEFGSDDEGDFLTAEGQEIEVLSSAEGLGFIGNPHRRTRPNGMAFGLHFCLMCSRLQVGSPNLVS